MTSERGWFGLTCWNGLSEAQQWRLIEWGNLEIGSRPAGDGCCRAATVAVETVADAAPGPRFYCAPCAVVYLQASEPAQALT
jgi:hypothetical protein